jgi:T-complex protein 1 subunit alpha
VTITNDGATILKLLDVEHPAAKMLVELAQQQDKEVGDGTTSVVIIASELLRLAHELVRKKIHPTTIIAGYRLASKEACKYIADHLTTKVEDLGRECLLNVAKTSMSSKIIGVYAGRVGLGLWLQRTCAWALTQVCGQGERFFRQHGGGGHAGRQDGQQQGHGQGSTVTRSRAARMRPRVVLSDGGRMGAQYPVGAVNILKAHGKSLRESLLVRGYALNCTVAAQSMCCCHVARKAPEGTTVADVMGRCRHGQVGQERQDRHPGHEPAKGQDEPRCPRCDRGPGADRRDQAAVRLPAAAPVCLGRAAHA